MSSSQGPVDVAGRIRLDNLVERARLPTSLHVAGRIAAAVESHHCTLEDIAAILETDIGLSAKVLRIANSPLFMGGGIETVKDALMYVGMGDIVALVAASEVMGAFEDAPLHDNPYQFWHENLFAAVAAQVIARHMQISEGKMYTVGLLRGVGELVIRAAMPAEAREIKVLQYKTKRALHNIEEELLGFHHAEVGAALLRGWRLPETIVIPIENYINPYLSSKHQKEAAILNLACFMKNEEYDIPQPPLINDLIRNEFGQRHEFLSDVGPEVTRLNRDSAKLVMG